MSKPEDIPQDVWDQAVSIYPGGNDWDSHTLRENIARAILAAEKRGEEREREACAQVLTFLELEADDSAPDDYRDGYEAGGAEFSVFSAAAIRARTTS